MPDPNLPTSLGRYQLHGELGRGGMATVVRGYDPRFEREVAIKLLPADLLHDPGLRARFEREAKTIAMLEHPGIVPVYDYGEEAGRLYLVMRLMSGGSLADRLRREGALPDAEILRITERVASALDAAHAKGIIHRDLKPANILFDDYRNPMISDFGIAKLSQATVALTQTNAMVGTPAYMSPEQVRGDADIDRRSDLYSFGVIVFEMLTGQQPYAADTPYGVMMKHVIDPVPRITDSNPQLAPECQAVVERAMAKTREARFGSAHDLTATLHHALRPPAPTRASTPETPAAPTPAPPPTLQTAAPPRAALRWALIAVAGLGVLGLSLAAGLGLGRLWQAAPAATTTATVSAAPTATAPPAPTLTSAPAVAAPTPTLAPSATVAPTPTLVPLTFTSLSLEGVANGSLAADYAAPPTGAVTLGEVPFILDGRAFKSQAAPAPNNTFPVSAVLPVNRPHVERVFLLLTAGDGFTRWRGAVIGRVTLAFDTAAPVRVDLILGDQVREWHPADNVVSDAPGAVEVWRGPITGFPSLFGQLDMLTVEVPADRWAATLTTVTLEDLSTETVNSRDPALTLAGVTLAHR